jgi:hypothetical protein
MIRSALVVMAVAFAFEGSAAAKGAGGIVLPPLEVDLGATAPVGGGEAIGPSRDILIGVHWASLFWKPTSYEVGVGYVGSFRDLKHGEPNDSFQLHGGYLALGRTLYAVPHMRTWVELRGELLRGSVPGRDFSALGGAVRFAAELYASGVGGVGDRSAIALFAGTIALGVFVEASHRDIASELGPTGVSTGVSIRIPFLLAAAG